MNLIYSGLYEHLGVPFWRVLLARLGMLTLGCIPRRSGTRRCPPVYLTTLYCNRFSCCHGADDAYARIYGYFKRQLSRVACVPLYPDYSENGGMLREDYDWESSSLGFWFFFFFLISQ